MMRRTEWLNQNAYRAYPLVEDSDMTLTGNRQLPDSALLDLRAVTYRIDPAPLVLNRIVVAPGGMVANVTFHLNFVGDTNDIKITVPRNAATPYWAATRWPGHETLYYAVGPGIVEIAAWGPGTYTAQHSIPVEPANIAYLVRHQLDSVEAVGSNQVKFTSGAIAVEAGHNCAVLVDPGNRRILISAILGAGKGAYCDPLTPATVTCGDVFVYMNGLHADSMGNLSLQPGPGFTMTADPANNTITFKSAKSKQETVCSDP